MAARDDAERLLERMQRKAAGWRTSDLRSLYTGFDFAAREGGRHTVYEHSRYGELTAAVKRHPGELPKAYISHAIKLIKRLKELEAAEEEEQQDEQE